MRELPRIKAWKPIWTGVFENYALKCIEHHKWRCDPINTSKDLLQDAFIVFSKVRDSYPLVDNHNAFKHLFKSALINMITDKARKRRRSPVPASLESDVYEAELNRLGSYDENMGHFSHKLGDLPNEVKEALDLLLSQPEILLGTKSDVEINHTLRAALGFDKLRLEVHRRFDFVTPLRALLNERETYGISH